MSTKNTKDTKDTKWILKYLSEDTRLQLFRKNQKNGHLNAFFVFLYGF